MSTEKNNHDPEWQALNKRKSTLESCIRVAQKSGERKTARRLWVRRDEIMDSMSRISRFHASMEVMKSMGSMEPTR